MRDLKSKLLRALGVLVAATLAGVLTIAWQGPLSRQIPELKSFRPATAPTKSAAPSVSPSLTGSSPSPNTTKAEVKRMLTDAAGRHGLSPSLVMAVAWWESGWDQSKVSPTGAVGIMQVEPGTAASAGPLLLHRNAAVNDPADNIDLGTAVLKEDMDLYNGDLSKALIAYYAGPSAVRPWYLEDPYAQQYVVGVYQLQAAFENGSGPA